MRALHRLNPGPGLSDFWSEFRKPQPYRWPILAVSALPFAVIFYWAAGEEVYLPPERPSVTYITSFAPDRSEAEIVASNEANQAKKDELRAQQEEFEQKKREMYRALGRATGVDVDAMEAQIEAERAQKAAEKQQTPTKPEAGVAGSTR
ncbi:MAG: hypothetical protein C0510_08050 [Erythrobacter sp.]|nr:hypothetical protein [Erythrobacter sp.]